jgi:hypothetical protein
VVSCTLSPSNKTSRLMMSDEFILLMKCDFTKTWLINWMIYWFQSYHEMSLPMAYVFRFWYSFSKMVLLEPLKNRL